MYEGAPRIRFMKELGYTFAVPPKSWQNKLSVKATRILGVLERSMMPHAIKVIEKQRHEIIKAYPWHGPPIRLKRPSTEFAGIDGLTVQGP
jgi:hypothetical protein